MKVVIDRDSAYAPCSYLLCKVDADGNWDTRDDMNTYVFQSDWDFPGLASIYGYVACECGCTDGTIEACDGRSATDMILEACDYMDARLGEVVDSMTADEYFKMEASPCK